MRNVGHVLRRSGDAAIGGTLEADSRATGRAMCGDKDLDGAVEKSICVKKFAILLRREV
jgi:hypothetical protein